MAADPFVVYDSAILEFMNGTQDWITDNHYVVLLTSAYTPSVSHSTFADISTYECADPDYLAQNLTGETATPSGSITICDALDVPFGYSISITARYLAIVRGTVGSKSGTDRLVGYMLMDNLPADIVTLNQPLIIVWDINGIFNVSRA